ncbi:MAG: hypothetical protein JWO88_3619, partial [Frankiales bacterium]|nr:hypothetical protein [Frankiales bacterium]
VGGSIPSPATNLFNWLVHSGQELTFYKNTVSSTKLARAALTSTSLCAR